MKNEKNDITAILFDFGGVFIPVADEDQELLMAFKKLYLDAYPLKKTFLPEYMVLVKALLRKMTCGEPVSVVWNEFEQETNVSKPQHLEEFLVRPYRHVELNSEMLVLVDALRKNRYKNGLVSNTLQPHVDYFWEKGLYKPFDRLILSCIEKVAKPDSRIWKVALGRIAGFDVNLENVEKALSHKEYQKIAKKTVYLDDIEENTQAYERELGGPAVPHKDPNATIEALRELGVRC